MRPAEAGRRQGSPCSCCFKLVMSLGFTSLVLWLIYRPIRPRYYVTALSLNATAATFRLEIENKNREMGVYHDDLALTLSLPNRSLAARIPPFYQGHRKTADKDALALPLPTGAAAPATTAPSAVRVAVVSTYRYKVLVWKTRRHTVSVSGDVDVDAGGKKTAEKGIRLSPAPPPPPAAAAALVAACAAAAALTALI